ncbi:ankyrin repeat domain-containing protein [Geomonas sp. Red276]
MKTQPDLIFAGELLQLAHAITANDSDRIKALVKSGVNPNGYGKQGITPLLFAFGWGSKKAFNTLLEYGADPNMPITANDASPRLKNQSATGFIAGAPDNDYLIMLLSHGANVDTKNVDGQPITVQMIFMDPPNYGGLRILLDHGADINATDSGGGTLLTILGELRDFEQVYYLLTRGADYRIKDGTGYGVDYHIYQEKIDPKAFPEAYAVQLKCQEFLRSRGVKDPGPMKPRTPQEIEDFDRLMRKAFDADRERREREGQ